ncbi:ATP-dependent RNA helicase DHX58-like [Saccoglossus kowalevskii]
MCRRYYREKEKKLKELIALEKVKDNPKLEVLVSKLEEIYNRNKLSRGIVFGRTRAATAALKSFIGDQEQLCKFVQVDRLVGKGKEEDGFMNDGQQQRVLKNFRKGLQNGGINLLVATDVAQEGLDIPDCNFIFRYEFVSNEIGSVQARGRARAYAAICYLIVESNSINEKREKQNQKREEDMKKAMKQLREADEGELTEQIKQRQLVLLNEYKEAQKKKERRRNMHGVEGIRVLCKECNHFVCDATYLLKKGTHYICTDPEFFNRIRETRYRKPQVYRDTDNIGLICCGNDSCNKQFGPLVLYKKGVQMTACALSCRSLIFDMNSPYGLIQFPKWAKCSFPIREEQY